MSLIKEARERDNCKIDFTLKKKKRKRTKNLVRGECYYYRLCLFDLSIFDYEMPRDVYYKTLFKFTFALIFA